MRVDALFRPVSARPLAALRVGLPLLLLAHLIWLSDDLLSLHGSRGIIPWELTNLLRDPWVPGLPTLARALLPFGIIEHTAITLLLSVYAGSLLALALGFQARLSAFLAWSLHLSLTISGSASSYGVDQLANTFLFYLFVFPSGRSREETIPVGVLRVMQLHLCVVYLAAGLDKAMGSQWWNGEAIWQTVSQPIFTTFDLSGLASHAWIPALAGRSTLVVEIGYAFLIWPRRTRKAWCLAAIGFHVGTAVIMGLVFFASVMILLSACLFLVPEQVTERSVAPARGPVLASLLVFAALPSVDLEPLVRRLMARDQIPGVAVGVVERGQLVFARGYGYRDLDRRLPVTPDTLFALGSCSKAFTATAIAQLADEGRLSLDTPVRTYLPDFSLEDPLASATLTTRDLLTHQSGLPRHDFFWYQAPFSRDELYGRLRFLEPVGPPRSQWRYNSLMFVVAGRVVENVSGQSWERFVQTRILEPLDMRRTVLSAEAMEADADHASPYALRDGRVQAIPMLKRLNAIAPAGAVQTSVRDLARWLTFHAMGSPELLGDAMWRELHRPQVEMPAPPEPEVQQPHYALGWIHESYRGHPLVFHNGAIDGFTVHLGFLPETGQGLIILTNRDLARDAVMTLAFSTYDRLLQLERIDWEARFKETPESLRRVSARALDLPLETLAGRYEHPAYGPLTVRADGNTLVVAFRDLHFTLAYQGNRRFLSQEPIAVGAPQIAMWFSKPSMGEPLQLFVPLNFDEGDPVQVFTRVASQSIRAKTRRASMPPATQPTSARSRGPIAACRNATGPGAGVSHSTGSQLERSAPVRRTAMRSPRAASCSTHAASTPPSGPTASTGE
jgi:CubicO group peptidase (beta-lactamase class C family)